MASLDPTDREKVISALVDAGDAPGLLALVEWGMCGCRGAFGDEPKCRCRMTADAVAARVLISGLRRGRLIPVRKQ